MPDSLATAGPKYLGLLRHPSVLSALAIGLAVAEVLVDVSTWIELNIAIIYSLPLVLAAAARNRRLLWALAFILIGVTFLVYWQQDMGDIPVLQDQYFINRVLAAVSVLLAAVLLHALSVAAEALDARNKQLSAYQQEITQRNRELDRQRAEAEEASDRKTRLLMSVSHDIRSPLTTINLMADLIKSTTSDPEHLAKLPRLAHNLQTNALSLAELVTDVLDIAYFDSGRVELRETDFSLSDVIAEECRLLEPLAAAKGLSLAPALTEPAIWLRADRIKLARVLRNLINNAIQFTARGGVTVAGALSSERAVEIRVIDTGIGIRPENLQRIFGEFTQVSDRRSGERAGWGLGLTICRRLARLMGGDVTAESAQSSGSVFIVHLPPSRVLPRS
jgi:signal transduction histidine kinase